MTHVVSANFVRSGAVVYVAKGPAWTEKLSEAATFDTDADKDAALAWAATQEHLVCDPYAVEVHKGNHGPVPLSAREQIRAGGATPVLTRLGHGAALKRNRKVA